VLIGHTLTRANQSGQTSTKHYTISNGLNQRKSPVVRASIPLSLRSFAYALPVLHYIFLSQNGLCSPSKLSAFIARQRRFRLPNLHPPALGVYINRVQRAHLICELLHIFTYTLSEVEYVHHSKKKKVAFHATTHLQRLFLRSTTLGHFGLPSLHPPPRHFLSPLTGSGG
jgi:hypothetical protein